MKDKDLFKFDNGIEYLDRLIFLARCRLQCTLLEMGYDVETNDFGRTWGREKIDDHLQKLFTTAENKLRNGVFLPLEYLFWLFDCDLFERHAVVIALLTQIYPETSYFFASINSDEHLHSATPFALCRTYKKQSQYVEYYPYFAKGAKLLKYFFTQDEVNVYTRLTLDQRILEFILGATVKQSYYAPIATLWSQEEHGEDEEMLVDKQVVTRLGAYIQNRDDFGKHTVFNLFGEQGAGRRSCIKHIARESGLNLMFIDSFFLATEKEPLDLVERIIRECLIFQAIPVVVYPSEVMTAGNKVVISYLLDAIENNFNYSFAISEQQLLPTSIKDGVILITFELGRLSLESSVKHWERESQKYRVDQEVNFFELAGEFTLTPGQIKRAFRAAAAIADLYGNGIINLSDLKRGCYNSLQFSMGSKAIKLEPIYTWDDLVLPPYQKDLLMTACNQVRYKYTVYQKWGFQNKMSYGKNVSMLFTGPPGTGKTMAAQVVSNELGLDVYKIELATVVSKYIGETEKNLNEIFQQARKSQVILFFDEADVLFSKRTEVKDSHDKYSNMEAAFLLQKMEEYDGITILATNYIQNFDEAFKRRIKFVIDFPFPNAEERRQIWQKVFPPQLPLGN